MSEFLASFSISQSSNCQTITLVDSSNYEDNDQGLAREDFATRKFEIRDSIGLLLTTLEIPNSGPSMDTVTYTLDSASYLSIKLVLDKTTAPAASFTKTTNSVFTCHLELCYANIVNDTDCCDDGSECDLRDKILQSIKSAQIFGIYGNGIKAQKSLDYGTSLCDGSCGCN